MVNQTTYVLYSHHTFRLAVFVRRTLICYRLAEPSSANLETAARRYSLAVPRVWNTLPQTVRQAETVSAFKSALKTHFFRQNT